MGSESWITSHWLEVFGALTGIIYVFLEIRQNIWLWPVGIVTSSVYILVFFSSKFYADMGLQVYYLFISFYGLWAWKYGTRKDIKNSSQDIPLRVEHTPIHLIHKLIVVYIIIQLSLWYILAYHTDSPVPAGDSFTTALSVVATWMLARKYIEHWLIWIIVNIVSMILYIYKGLYPTTILFMVYLIMAVVGYREWLTDMKTK